MTPYENLANAIIIQAVKDYRTALKTLKRNPDNMDAADTVNEVERFFFTPSGIRLYRTYLANISFEN